VAKGFGTRMHIRFVLVTKIEGNKAEVAIDGNKATVEIPKGYRYSVGNRMKIRRVGFAGWQHAEI
jgi:hypothetical protein